MKKTSVKKERTVHTRASGHPTEAEKRRYVHAQARFKKEEAKIARKQKI